MPRKAKLASGAGLPASPSGNRTDLPITAPQGLPYGEAGDLQAAQAAAPMASGPPPLPSAPAGGAPGPGGPAGMGVPGGSVPPAGGLGAILAAAQQMNPPSQPGLSAPTQRPNEPVTSGLSTGPGPGPEALDMQRPISPTAMVFSTLAKFNGSPLMASMAATAQEQGL